MEQCEGKLDYLVAGAGTGGTISGIGRKLRELSPHTKVIAVDPEGSLLAEPAELNDSTVQFYDVEGIGYATYFYKCYKFGSNQNTQTYCFSFSSYDFVPTVLDRDVIDSWVKTTDKESFLAARRLIKEEGLLCGGSSGAALTVALNIAKTLPADKRIVVLLPDGIRNYMTKFVSDLWMESRNFLVITSLNNTSRK